MKTTFITLSTVVLMAACGGIEPKMKSISEYRTIADSLTKSAQNTLAMNLANALSTEGPAGAVDFCNVHALPITDSLSRLFGCSIERLSNNNRNERNAFYDERDDKVFNNFVSAGTADTIFADHQHIYYYKPIKIAMPICLTCHGKPDEIPADVQAQLKEKYPNDKAIGYALNDYRGVWKLTFDLPQQTIKP